MNTIGILHLSPRQTPTAIHHKIDRSGKVTIADELLVAQLTQPKAQHVRKIKETGGNELHGQLESTSPSRRVPVNRRQEHGSRPACLVAIWSGVTTFRTPAIGRQKSRLSRAGGLPRPSRFRLNFADPWRSSLGCFSEDEARNLPWAQTPISRLLGVLPNGLSVHFF